MAVNELGVIPKKKKFVWTDADENEMRDYCKIPIYDNSLYLDLNEKKHNMDENMPALMIGTSTSMLENLNPTLLSAL